MGPEDDHHAAGHLLQEHSASGKGQGAASACPEGSRDSRISRVTFTQKAPFQLSRSYLFPFSILTSIWKHFQG